MKRDRIRGAPPRVRSSYFGPFLDIIGGETVIKVNGETFEGKDGITVAELLSERGYKTVFIAVEVNGAIVKKEDYGSFALKDGDKVEVVNFVGGG